MKYSEDARKEKQKHYHHKKAGQEKEAAHNRDQNPYYL
jgi:hypothetical protein